jgi:hypothetical protein
MRWLIASAVVVAAYGTTLCLVPALPLRAQSGDFSCPKAGVSVTYKVSETGVEWTDTYHGADPSDPMMCLLTGAAATKGPGEHRLLYNS